MTIFQGDWYVHILIWYVHIEIGVNVPVYPYVTFETKYKEGHNSSFIIIIMCAYQIDMYTSLFNRVVINRPNKETYK